MIPSCNAHSRIPLEKASWATSALGEATSTSSQGMLDYMATMFLESFSSILHLLSWVFITSHSNLFLPLNVALATFLYLLSIVSYSIPTYKVNHCLQGNVRILAWTLN